MGKKIKGLLMLLVLLALSGMTVFATSNTLTEIEKQVKAQEEKQKSLAQQKKDYERRKKEQQSLLNEIESQFGVIESRLEVGNQEIQAIYAGIRELEVEIVNLNLTISELELALEIKDNEINEARLELQFIRRDKELLNEQARERIRVMYEYGDAGFLDIMLEATNLMELFGRIEYINRLVQADNNLFANLDRYEDDIVGKEAELEIFEATLKNLADEAFTERAMLEEKVISKGLEVQHANDLIDAQKAYQDTLEDEEKETEETIKSYNAKIDQIEEEEKRVDRDLKDTLARKAAEINRLNGYDYNGGMILWPVPGWSRISSKFGPRLHPIHKTWKNHNGIDIPANSGTPVIAVMTGEVIIAKYSSSYGNYVAIAHGNGFVSLYAHCSSLNVKVGDKVNANDTIARVGTTGWSTGNHLHFGFQKDDVWVDPQKYIN